MKRVALALAVASCSSSSAPRVPEVKVWGALREMIHDGRVEARVKVAEVTAAGTYGVGAVAGMRGEITIVDGTPWIAIGSSDDGRAHEGPTDESAALLVAANVQAWSSTTIDTDIAAAELDARIEKYARAAALPIDKPIPFVIEGVVDARWHVLKTPPAPGADPHDHTANAIVGTLAGRATVVGFFSQHHQGVFTHMGHTVHAHVVDGTSIAAHADELAIHAGSVLRFPR